MYDPDASSPQSAIAEQPAAGQAIQSPSPALEYEFITRLPRQQMTVDAEAYQPLPVADREPREYLLQAASFLNRDDADAMRAQLILEGMDVAVDAVPRSGGGAWHRVLVGPFARKIDMERTLTKLRAKDIPALVVERALPDPA